MAIATPDRALRRVVARLAAEHPDDLIAVLDELDPVQRSRARALLNAYLQPDRSEGRDVVAGLSPWLAARLADRDGTDAAAALRPRAREALQAAGARLATTAPPAVKPSTLASLAAAFRGGPR